MTRLLVRLSRNYELYLFLTPAIIYYFLFHYLPMYGVQLAFKNYNPMQGIFGSPWVGMKHIMRFLNSPNFWDIMGNTLGISLFQLAVGFPIPIILALLLNEIAGKRYRKLLQTVTYAPHFISTVVMVSMIMIFLNPDYGFVNVILGWFGYEPVHFLAEAAWFKTVYVLSGVWQNAGWGSIIYLAALAGVDHEQHEAAMIDGATRLQRIRHVNIPGIMPTIVILFILEVGHLMSVGFEKVFLMQNPLTLESSEIISTYVYKVGLLNVQYSFSAAVGLFNSILNFILLIFVNGLARRISQTSLW